MHSRDHHRQEVQAFLQANFSVRRWDLTFPQGSGHETYLARSDDGAYFVKLGAQSARYEALTSVGLTPPVLVVGTLEDGTSILVQPWLLARTPTRADYLAHLEQIATAIHNTHHNLQLQRVLPTAASDLYSYAGSEALARIERRWGNFKAQVPNEVDFVDRSLADLAAQVRSLSGAGLVASHNDMCNANWLVTPEDRFYLVDLELMSLDDPAADLGATLWWYYPPALRGKFLEIAGYTDNEVLRQRMRVRMAMHCLSIILPREDSFDSYDPTSFGQSLTDLRAALAGEQNPQGYD